MTVAARRHPSGPARDRGAMPPQFRPKAGEGR
jgi:hypothetical protein